jgi:hypothetical protein
VRTPQTLAVTEIAIATGEEACTQSDLQQVLAKQTSKYG